MKKRVPFTSEHTSKDKWYYNGMRKNNALPYTQAQVYTYVQTINFQWESHAMSRTDSSNGNLHHWMDPSIPTKFTQDPPQFHSLKPLVGDTALYSNQESPQFHPLKPLVENTSLYSPSLSPPTSLELVHFHGHSYSSKGSTISYCTWFPWLRCLGAVAIPREESADWGKHPWLQDPMWAYSIFHPFTHSLTQSHEARDVFVNFSMQSSQKHPWLQDQCEPILYFTHSLTHTKSAKVHKEETPMELFPSSLAHNARSLMMLANFVIHLWTIIINKGCTLHIWIKRMECAEGCIK